MLIVGLTGGIASGKSTVDRMFEDAGIPVICSDELAHQVVEPGSPALEQIREVFGEDVLNEDGSLDRAAMGTVVFHDEIKRKALESIIHPRVAEERDKLVRHFEGQGYEIMVVDVPLMYEAGWDKDSDHIIVVYTPRSVQLQRLMERDSMSREDAYSRIEAQASMEEKRKKADFLIENTGDPAYTRAQVADLIQHLEVLAEEMKTRKAVNR
jgi:dephospho-CoA kinase